MIKALAATILVFSSLYALSRTHIESEQFDHNYQEESFKFSDDFYFGLANSPSHSEDKVNDSWMKLAKKGKVASIQNHKFPEYRTGFWSEPEIELNIAQKSGISVFKLGLDWTRLAPKSNLDAYILNQEAVSRYRQIISMARARGMRVIVSLFQTTLPKSIEAKGGWSHSDTRLEFARYSAACANAFKDLIDDWITFEAPSVYVAMTHLTGTFPPGYKIKPFGLVNLGPFEGQFIEVHRRMALAHKDAFNIIHLLDDQGQRTRIGIAQNAEFYTGESRLDKLTARLVHQKLVMDFPEMVYKELDFIGINYYGETHIQGTGVTYTDKAEYSDSGHQINPKGLYQLTKLIWNRVNYLRKKSGIQNKLSITITENGISDDSDQLRPAYLVEHLWAVAQLIKENIPVEGYIFWTIADSWELSDGYCPRSGLYKIERTNDSLIWQERPSFSFFKHLVKERTLSEKLRSDAWSKILPGSNRAFCRDENNNSPLDKPKIRKVSNANWKFAK